MDCGIEISGLKETIPETYYEEIIGDNFMRRSLENNLRNLYENLMKLGSLILIYDIIN